MIGWGIVTAPISSRGEYSLWVVPGVLLALIGYVTRPRRGAPSKSRDPAGYQAWLSARIRQTMAQSCTQAPQAGLRESV
jgi:hypothetical protein